jgi:hypothetical protein
MKNLAVALIVSSAALCFAGQSSLQSGAICGHVIRADTHQPIADATVTADNPGRRPPLPTQATRSDGSFCIRSLSLGDEYKVFIFKTGFILDREFATILPRNSEREIEVKLVPALPVISAEDALAAVSTPEQRQSLQFEHGTFSPDGRYFAVPVSLTGKDSSYGQEVLRYDFMAHKLMAVTPEPTARTLPNIDGFAWSGDVLYTAVTYTWEVGRNVFFRTDGDSTTAIESFPAQLKMPIQAFPLEIQVGPFVVDGHYVTGAEIELSTGSTVITDVGDDFWATLDNPPTVFYGEDGLQVFYLRTHRRQVVRVASGTVELLGVTSIPNGFRLAFWQNGKCGVDPRTLSPDFSIPGNLPSSLCFVDVPDESRLDDSASASPAK